MNLFRPALLFWVCILALVGAATAGAQTPPLVASFEVTPAEPVAGELVTLTDTTKNPSGAPLEYSWDLDADDQFDDGTSMAMTHSFATAGPHRVALRVRRIGTSTQTDSEAKTIIVKEAATPAATPTATPTAAPTVSAPKLALPPVARIGRECAPFGPTTVCLGPLMKPDTVKHFDASESSDADGQIVRYQWDLDGNGSFEVDTGQTPRVETIYRDDKADAIRLRVTDDDGATDETGMALTKLPLACYPSITFGRVHATSPCLQRYTLTNGSQYRSKFPVTVNGVTITPAAGKEVLVNVLGEGVLRRLEIIAGSALATFPAKGENLRLQEGPLRWKLGHNELLNVGSLDGQKLNGLRISGAPAGSLELPTRGVARIPVFLKLPDAFGAPTSEKPVVLIAGSPKADLTARAAAADDKFEFSVPNAAIGPIGLNTLKVSYDGAGLWEIDADLDVPVLDARIHGKAGILNGDFNYAGLDIGFPAPGLGPLGPLFIQHIKFRVEVNPKRSECVPHLGVESETFLGYTFVTDYGVPTFALCGEVGLTGGPKILGASAVSLNAGLGLVTYDDRPSVLRAYGDMKVMELLPFASATFEAHTDGFLKVKGRFDYTWSGFASVSGHISLGMLGSKFNAEGGVKACLDFVEFCRGVDALISSKGMAVCMVFDYWVDDWRPGFGYKWGDSLPTPYFSGCSLGPYRETIKRAKAASLEEQTVTLPDGLPGTVIAATGVNGPPKLTLVGPKGERISTPDDLMPVEAKPFFLMKNPQAKLTQIAVMRPGRGEWRVILEDGSSPISSLKVAHAMDAPKIEARIAGRPYERNLRFEVEPRRGQEVSFIERGKSTSGEIGKAYAAKGELPFVPAGGAAETREIVAIVEQDGMVSQQLVVARYRAPGARKPGTVTRLRSQRLPRNALRVAFEKAPRGDRHVVTVALADGRRIVRQIDGRSLTLRGIPRPTRAKVAVRALSESGVLGSTARLRIR